MQVRRKRRELNLPTKEKSLRLEEPSLRNYDKEQRMEI
jgi:hypothetical protein